MEYTGYVKNIVYRNDSNSYTVADFHVDEKNANLKIVGYLPFVDEGDTLKVCGRMSVHPEYGEQFNVDTFEKSVPSGKVSIERYLASRCNKRYWTYNC